MADMIEVAKATVTIIPTMQGAQQTIAKEMGEAAEPAAKESGKKAGSSFANSMGSGIKTAGKVVAAGVAAVTGAAVAGAKGLYEAAQATADYGDNVDKMSQKIGISTDAYQEWSYVFERSGANVDNLQVGMKKLSTVITDASNGSESAAEKLDAVGISLEEIQGLSQEDALSLVISRLQEMGPTAERTAAASDLLGKSATDMAAVLNMTAEETQELINEAHEYGMVMSEDAVKSSAGFNDSLTKMQGAIAGVKNGVIAEFLPGITSVMDGFAMLAAGEEGAEEKIGQGIDDTVNKVTELLPQAVEVGAKLIIQLGVGLIKALPDLLANSGDIITAIFDAFKEVDWLDLGVNIVKGIGQGVLSMADAFLKIIKDLAKSAWDGIKDFFGISSPSKLMIYGGNMIGEGLIEGIDETKPKLQTTVQSVDRIISTGMVNQPIQRYEPEHSSGGNIEDRIVDALSSMGVQIEIVADADGDKIFKIVRTEARVFKKRTGLEAFA